jgi:hypothetical protein
MLSFPQLKGQLSTGQSRPGLTRSPNEARRTIILTVGTTRLHICQDGDQTVIVGKCEYETSGKQP